MWTVICQHFRFVCPGNVSAAHLGFSFRSGLKQRAIVAQLSRNSPTQKKRSNTETTESLDSVHRHGPHEQRRQSQLAEIIFTLVADYWTQYYTTHSYSPHLAASAALNWLVIQFLRTIQTLKDSSHFTTCQWSITVTLPRWYLLQSESCPAVQAALPSSSCLVLSSRWQSIDLV